MTKIKWDNVGERIFEAGVDRGVFYPANAPGVPWNGLVGINQTPDGGTSTPYYLDGFKYHNETSSEEYVATLEAFTYPAEFAAYDGSGTGGRGLSYGEQPRKPFGLSYRTLVGNDTEGVEYGYVIHLVYDVLASPSQRSRGTLTNAIDPINFSWALSSKAQNISGRKPTAHLEISSLDSDPEALSKIENILYGTPTTEPRLPSPEEVIDIFDDWVRLEIVPDLSNGLSPLKYHGRPDLKGDVFVGIYKAPEETRLKTTSTPGLYRLE